MICVLGDSGVGKSALLRKFKKPEQEWESMDHQATIGVDYVRRAIQVEGRSVLLQSWDTAGQDRFRAITSSYYRSALGAIICYDCTNEESLRNAKQWIEDFREKAREGAPILLVATKDDLSSKLNPSEEHKGSISQSGSSGEVAESRNNANQQRLLLPSQQGETTEANFDSIMVVGCEEELMVEQSRNSFQLQTPSFIVRKTLLQKGRDIAHDEQCGFISTSARTGHNTQAAFEQIALLILIAQGHLEQTKANGLNVS